MVAHLPETPTARRLAPLVEALRSELADLRLVYVFGSVAHGTQHPGSDVDLALLAGRTMSPLALFDLAARLSELAGREVDLIDLAAASTVLRKEVVAAGELLFEQTPDTRVAFEGRVLADYARLNEERRPVLERIAREGRVHA